MGLSQMKSAADVQDLESMRTFASSQAEVASGMNKKIMEDVKTLSDMTMEVQNPDGRHHGRGAQHRLKRQDNC